MLKIILMSVLMLLLGLVIFTGLSSFLYAELGKYKFQVFLWYGAFFHKTNLPLLVFSGLAAGIVGLLPLILYIKSFFKKRELHGSARFATAPEIKKMGLYNGGGDKLLIGKFKRKYLYDQGNLHPFLAAPIGSGKGVGFVIPNLLNWEGSVVITDMKKEAWQVTSGYRTTVLKQKCHFFDPLNDNKNTCRINPFSYVRVGTDHVVSDIRAIGDILISGADGGEGNQWDGFARKLFISISLLVLEAGSILGWKKTIGQVYKVINSENDLVEVIEKSIAVAEEIAPLTDECKGALLSFSRQPEKQREGTITTLDGALQLWQSPLVDLATSANDVDFMTFRVTPQSLYLVSNNSDLAKLKSLFRLIFQTLVDVNSNKTKADDPRLKVPLLLLMDEFLSLGKMPKIIHAMSYVRGYGIRLSPVLQSPSQLVSVYGAADTDAFLENTSTRIVYRPNSTESAKKTSEMLGTQTFKATSISKTKGSRRSVSTSDQSRALFLPQELRELPDDRSLLFLEKEKPIFSHKIFFYKERFFKKRLLPEAKVPEPNISGKAVSVSVESLSKQSNQEFSDSNIEEIAGLIFDKYC